MKAFDLFILELIQARTRNELVHSEFGQKWTRKFSYLFCGASERRVWLSAESKILASTFWTFSLVSVKRMEMQSSATFWLFFFHSEFENMSLQNLNCYFRPVDFIAFSQPKIPENPTASELIVWVINNYLKIVIISKFHMICILQSLIMVTHAQILTPFLP